MGQLPETGSVWPNGGDLVSRTSTVPSSRKDKSPGLRRRSAPVGKACQGNEGQADSARDHNREEPPTPRHILSMREKLESRKRLRDEGLLEFRRGRGITVAGAPDRGAVVAQARELVRFARDHGYRVDELVGIIKSFG